MKPYAYMPLTAYEPVAVFKGHIRVLSDVQGAPGDITEQGAIASAMDLPYGRELRIYDSTGENIVPLNAGPFSVRVRAMNEAGDVLLYDWGFLDWNSGETASFVRDGRVREIGYLDSSYRATSVTAMNAAGQVVGGSLESPESALAHVASKSII